MMIDARQPISREAGFSLLEIIAVMALLTLAAALVMPQLRNTRQSLRLRTVAVDIASNLKMTRDQAMKTNTDAVFVLDTAKRSYAALGVLAPKAIPKDIAVSFESQAAETDGPSRAGFRFRPDGTASGGAIKLQAGASVSAISIDWLSGAVTLKGQ
jgi:general secretion pathway protein H